MANILIGNTFPLTLARRKIIITPEPLTALQPAASGKRIASFWGHTNTLRSASKATGLDLTPQTERPVLELSPEGLPMLGEQVFKECWVISPDYNKNFRPNANQPVDVENIMSWQCLKITWI